MLSFVIAINMATPIFASSTGETKKTIMVSFGDSIGVGFANDGRHTEFIEFDKGIKHHSFTQYPTVKTSYPSLLAKKLGGVDEDNSYNGVYNALRAKDLCYFMGLIDEDEYYSTIPTKSFKPNEDTNSSDWYSSFVSTGDGLLGEDFTINGIGMDNLISTNAGKYLSSQSNTQAMIDAVCKADIITVELGFNDFTAMLCNKGDELFGGIMGAVEDINKIGEMSDYVNAYKTAKSCCERMETVLLMMTKVADMGISALDCLNNTDKTINIAIKETNKYLDMFLKEIRNLNPTARIAVVNMYNPAANLDPSLLDEVSGLVAPDVGKYDVTGVMKLLFQPYVDKLNLSMLRIALKYDCQIADISRLVEPSSDNIFHPNEEGQEKIADIIRIALSECKISTIVQVAKDKRTRCKHSDTVIQGSIMPTYISDGYSGDKVCMECGEVVLYGKRIPKTVLNGTKIVKLRSTNNSIVLKWTNVKNVDGYRIRFKTPSKNSKETKRITVNGSKITRKTIKKLKSGKKYDVEIRTFKTVKDANGMPVKVYSKWSDKQSIRTKN